MLAFLVFLLLDAPANAGPVTAPDDYAVYVDFLRQATWDRAEIMKKAVGTFVIVDRTDLAGTGSFSIPRDWLLYDGMKWHFPELDSSTLHSFEVRNAKTVHLDAARFDGLPVALVSRRTIRNWFPRSASLPERWERFYERFPKAQGFLAFSSVGFSDDRRQALLYYGNQYDGLGGRGELLLFAWDGRQWMIIGRMQAWIS